MRFRFRIPPDKGADAVSFISGLGFSLSRHNAVNVLKREGNSVSIYDTGTVLCELKDDLYSRTVIHYFQNFRIDYNDYVRKVLGIEMKDSWAGTDEAGKGDYFGPLVVAGVCVENETAGKLFISGVTDSKKLSSLEIMRLSKFIESTVGREKIEVISISPERYNEMYDEAGNINDILMWAHSKVIRNLCVRNSCTAAVVDRFFASSRLNEMKSMLPGIELHAVTGGEREISVASASIIASAEFMRRLKELERKLGAEIPAGGGKKASAFARSMISEKGIDFFRKFGKANFRLQA
ncbi:MAG: ribonuclease HIII [Candidatus Thermoplasmatota archaeon]|nr:ribonuclease HIII [Candidatus Thermoplasmatota archaeon]